MDMMLVVAVELVKGELVERVYTSETSFQNPALVSVERNTNGGEVGVKSFEFRFGEGRRRWTRFETLFPDLSRDNVAPSEEWDHINVLSLAYHLTDTGWGLDPFFVTESVTTIFTSYALIVDAKLSLYPFAHERVIHFSVPYCGHI
jgi:hypothetical protein